MDKVVVASLMIQKRGKAVHLVNSEQNCRVQEEIVTHREPFWREQADFLVSVLVDPDSALEQLWVRQLDTYEFEICCIPFVAYGLALGDVVRTDERYMVVELLRPSGRRTFRIWREEGPWSERQDLIERFLGVGASLEVSSPRMIALDAADAEIAATLVRELQRLEDLGELMYEEG